MSTARHRTVGGEYRRRISATQLVKLGLVVPICLMAAGVNSVDAAEAGGQRSARQQGVLEEIVVTARRRAENLQDVPLTVNAVTAEDLRKLNIRNLQDIQSVVPGLTLDADPIAASASLRGVRFDAFASGNNPTVQFYINDAPTLSNVAIEALFDIDQVEVLRGPQGTLRGRAAPSGAITITTKKPDLEKFGGFVDLTATDTGGRNARGAVNLPIVKDKLGFRLAGLFEQNEGTRIRSINDNATENFETSGYRASLRFEPTDSLSIELMHQQLKPQSTIFQQVESANRQDPTLPPPTEGVISPNDRLAVTDFANEPDQVEELTTLNVHWDLGAVKLEYVGSLLHSQINRSKYQDTGDFWGPGSATKLQNYAQVLKGKGDVTSHELRMETTVGNFDLVAGGLYQKLQPKNRLQQQQQILSTGGSFLTTFNVPVSSAGQGTERSVYGNVTWHITDATELSAGLRYLLTKSSNLLVVNGGILSDTSEHWSDTIYMASLKHRFSDQFMAYTNVGTSWRAGVNTIGDFSTNQTARERNFLNLPPETSISYEVGFKSNWLENRLRLNADVYYQDFNNYTYRTGGAGGGSASVYYVNTNSSGVETVDQFAFVAAVPVKVYGAELEAEYQVTDRWNIGMVYSYSHGELDNATIPCNDYFPTDGEPDRGGQQPTVAQIRAATGGNNLAACSGTSFRASFAPPWSVTLRSEYSFPLFATEGFVRGLLTGYGDSKNDPTNELDDVSRYAIFDLYAGFRDPDGRWAVTFFGKNVTDTQRVLNRAASPESVSFTQVDLSTFQTSGGQGTSTYRAISITKPREFGINLRYNF